MPIFPTILSIFFYLISFQAQAQTKKSKGPICKESEEKANPKDFKNVFENFSRKKTIRLEGPKWDNTLIRNCFISDTSSDGIFLRNVKNIVIEDCVFKNISGKAAIRTSIKGLVDGLIIRRNKILNAQKDGIVVPQRIKVKSLTKGLIIDSNVISNTGLNHSRGYTHHIYVQSPEFIIRNNSLKGVRDGNGISIRSKGRISCNTIEGKSKSKKPGIRYYSDHDSTGSTELDGLWIQNNQISGQKIGIDIFKPVDRYDGKNGHGHVVKKFFLLNNSFESNHENIRISPIYLKNNSFVIKCIGKSDCPGAN